MWRGRARAGCAPSARKTAKFEGRTPLVACVTVSSPELSKTGNESRALSAHQGTNECTTVEKVWPKLGSPPKRRVPSQKKSVHSKGMIVTNARDVSPPTIGL